MTFDQYIDSLEGEHSAVKRQILERLWKEGKSFPRGWVKSSELLTITGQKYFDRRVRELRDETGCDIETGTVDGEHAYRLLSEDIKAGNPRAYLTAAQKKALFEAADHHCAICDSQFASGLRGLQADHKIPLIRGGSHNPSNWQPICVGCNVGKRRACAGCTMDCLVCPWAFPEKVGRRVIVQLPANLETSLASYAKSKKKSPTQCIVEAIQSYIAE